MTVLISGVRGQKSSQSLTALSSSNALDMLELHTTLLTPDLARYSCVHACELRKKSDFTLFGPKKLSSLIVLAIFDWDDKI